MLANSPIWFYLLAPLAGAVLGAWAYRSFSGRQAHGNDVRWRRQLNEARAEHEESIAKLTKTLQLSQEKQENLRQALSESDETVQLLSADRVPAYENDIAERNTRIAKLEKMLSHARARAADAKDQETTLERQIESLKSDLLERDQRIDELLARNAEFSALRKLTSDQEGRFSDQQIEIEKLDQALRKTKTDLHERERQITELNTKQHSQQDLRDRDLRIATLSEQFDELRKKLPALNDALREREASIEDLIAELSRERKKTFSLEQAIAQSRSVESGPVEVRRTRANVISISPHRETDAPDDTERQIRELDEELREWKRKSDASRKNVDHLASSHVKKRSSNLKAVSRRNKDDLKQIKGIGPVVETTLNQLGFFHVEQLAGIGKKDIDRLATHDSSLPGRLRRYKWIEQARQIQRSQQAGRRRPNA